jgi:hypothetical protein
VVNSLKRCGVLDTAACEALVFEASALSALGEAVFKPGLEAGLEAGLQAGLQAGASLGGGGTREWRWYEGVEVAPGLGRASGDDQASSAIHQARRCTVRAKQQQREAWESGLVRCGHTDERDEVSEAEAEGKWGALGSSSRDRGYGDTHPLRYFFSSTRSTPVTTAGSASVSHCVVIDSLGGMTRPLALLFDLAYRAAATVSTAAEDRLRSAPRLLKSRTTTRAPGSRPPLPASPQRAARDRAPFLINEKRRIIGNNNKQKTVTATALVPSHWPAVWCPELDEMRRDVLTHRRRNASKGSRSGAPGPVAAWWTQNQIFPNDVLASDTISGKLAAESAYNDSHTLLLKMLVKGWCYFPHFRGAKYSSKQFSKFSLPNGRYVHSTSVASYKQLQDLLEELLFRLRSSIRNCPEYKSIPVWVPPEPLDEPDFEPPDLMLVQEPPKVEVCVCEIRVHGLFLTSSCHLLYRLQSTRTLCHPSRRMQDQSQSYLHSTSALPKGNRSNCPNLANQSF